MFLEKLAVGEGALKLAESTLEKLKQQRCRLNTQSVPTLPANLLDPLPERLGHFDPTLQELSTLLGEEFERVFSDPPLLADWVITLRTNRMIEEGVVPPGFVHAASCKSCGPVLLAHAQNHVLDACPWCFSTNKLSSMPKAK